MVYLMGIATMAGLLLGPTASAEGPLTCSQQACEGERCWSVTVPCGWPCGEIDELSVRAKSGALSPDELTCIDGAWSASSSTDARQPFHQLLVSNAAASADWDGWRQLAIRQLEVAGAQPLVCADRSLLRARASAGQLSPSEIGCLENAAKMSQQDLERTDASRMLIGNARRRFDRGTWHELVHEHLRSVDPHDLTVAFDYQGVLTVSDPVVADNVRAWADAELPLSRGGTDTRGLYVIRGMADLAGLDQAESRAERSGTGIALAQWETAKRDVAARTAEWLDYERGWGADPSMALGACLITEGNCCDRPDMADHPSCFWRGYRSSDSPLDDRVLACTGGVDPQQLALVGRLEQSERSCLGGALATADQDLGVREHLSRILLTDAWASADHDRWQRTAELHLSMVSPNDPFVAYEYARFLSRGGDADPVQLLELTRLAMNHPRMRGSPDAPRKLYELHRIRTFAGYAQWEDAVSMRNSSPSFQTRRYAEQMRARASEFATAWSRYAGQTDMDSAEAKLLCEAAGGDCR